MLPRPSAVSISHHLGNPRFLQKLRTATLLLSAAALLTLIGWSLPARADDALDALSRPQQGRSMRASSTFRQGPDGKYDPAAPPKSDLEERSNSDNFRVAPGATHVLMDASGPGVITHMWMTFLGPEAQEWARNGSANHQEMLLKIYWDGSKRPGVEAPVGDFFANCFGRRDPVVSMPVVVDHGNSYNCFWRMPFRKSARVEIVNQSDKPISLLYYNIDWVKLDRLPRETPYFYAQYRQEYPTAHGRDYVVLDTKGRGHYVGTVLAVRTRSPMWFGEGDERIYIDGETTPSIQGTGTEDYFLLAWGLKRASNPYFGVPFFDQWGIVGGRTSAYRWHVNDPIVFKKGMRVTFEHFGWISPDENPEHKTTSWNEREDDYATVAFWYQAGEPSFEARAPAAAERKLPSIDRITVYGRNLTDPASRGQGDVVRQQLDLYEGPHLLCKPVRQEGAWLEIPFEVARKEPLRLLLNMTVSYDFGIYQAYLNGVRIGEPMDLYSADINSSEFHLLDFWPEPGKYTLRLECTGRNPLSQGHFLGLESLRLRERRPRVMEYGLDRSRDWKVNPVLYR